LGKEILHLPTFDFFSFQRKERYNSIWVLHVILWAEHAAIRGIGDTEFKLCDCIATCFTGLSKLKPSKKQVYLTIRRNTISIMQTHCSFLPVGAF
jgi:hypothetical protein